MKLIAIPAVIVALFALAGCTQHTPSAAPPTTTAADGTIWVPATVAAAAAKPPVAPTSYTRVNYEFPPPKGSGAGGSAIGLPAPAGWVKSQNGDKTDFRDPTGQLLVQVELADTPPVTSIPDESAYVVGLMRAREQATRAEYAGYHLISLGPIVLGPENLTGAQWQFTFVNNGVTRLVTVVGTDFDGFGTTYVSGPQQYISIVDTIASRERDIYVAG